MQAQQAANEANQQRQPQSYPQQRGGGRDYDEPRDFDPRGGDVGYGGGGGYYPQQEEPRFRQDYQPEYRQDYRPDYAQEERYEPQQQRQQQQRRGYEDEHRYGAPPPPPHEGRGGLPSNPRNGGGRSYNSQPPLPETPDFTTPQLGGEYSRAFGSGSSQGAEPPRDFDPNAQSSFGAGQQRYAEYAAPPQQAHRSQYVPTDPVRQRQRSLSGGKSRPEQRDVQRANQISGGGGVSGRPIYPEPGGRRPSGEPSRGGQGYNPDEYQYDEKASTVNLVDGADDYEMGRRGSGGRKPTKASGGPTIKRGDVPMEDMGEFFTEVRGDL